MVGALLTGTFGQGGVAITKPGITASSNAPNRTPPKKLLVCAPSNAAVDELVMRLKAGVVTTTGEHRSIKVVRLGRSEAANANVKDVTLEELVQARMGGEDGDKPFVSATAKLHEEAGKLKVQMQELRPKLDAARKGSDKSIELKLQREFDVIKRQQSHIGSKIDESKDSGHTVARDNELNRRRIQQQVVDEANVLCCTLSASGHDMFKHLSVEFETVIIDEAAQSIELSALIPLKYGCAKCILVGDPKQLPPTVFSKAAASFGYEQSLFVRMQNNHPDSVHLLDTQYRMHPEISYFPSQEFYDGQLIDGAGMALLRAQPWHANSLLGPYRYFDVKGTQSMGSSHSLVNLEEVKIAIQIYERLKIDFPHFDFYRKIGIITPYKAQLSELKARFSQKYGQEITEDIDFNTTDAFQGREADIIIFSCVRAKPTGGIGFMDNIKRMNVGLTRAKSSLWVLGDSQALMQGEYWSALINNAKQRQTYTAGDIQSMLRKPTTKMELQSFATKTPASSASLIPNKITAPASVPMEDIIYSSHLDVREKNALPKSESAGPPPQHDDNKEVERSGHDPQIMKSKPAKPMSFTDRLRKGIASQPIPPIRQVTSDKNGSGKRPLPSIDQSRVEPPLKKLPTMQNGEPCGSNTCLPSKSQPQRPPVPTNAALRPHVPKVIRKRPAADPLRRNQRK